MKYETHRDAMIIQAAIENGHALRSQAFYDFFQMIGTGLKRVFGGGLLPRNGYVAKLRNDYRLGISSLTHVREHAWRRQPDNPLPFNL